MLKVVYDIDSCKGRWMNYIGPISMTNLSRACQLKTRLYSIDACIYGNCLTCFKNGQTGQPRPLFNLFSVFFKQTNNVHFLRQINVKYYPPSIRLRDSNPRPLLHKQLNQGSRPSAKLVCAEIIPSHLN